MVTTEFLSVLDNRGVINFGELVQHKTGGPELCIVGFILPVSLNLYSNLGSELNQEQRTWICEKVELNRNNYEFNLYSRLNSTHFYGGIFNNNEVFSNWIYEGKSVSKFYCLCRFFDPLIGDFRIRCFDPVELLFIN